MNEPRRILIVHNAYQQHGGEDVVARSEAELLRKHGHAVTLYQRHNDEVETSGKASVALQTLWSSRSHRELREMVADFRPDVAHVHNTFPLISPSAYWALAGSKVPVVQTLHNFRLLCPQAMFLREGRVCEDCLGTLPWRAVSRRCYRDSVAASGVLATMLGVHRSLGTFQNKVARYIALNEFARRKYVLGGLPQDRVVIKPNFVEGGRAPPQTGRRGALFVGRLSPEKGLDTLLAAVDQVADIALTVVGSGPMQAHVAASSRVRMLGWQRPESIRGEMEQACFLVIPSVWYENFPMTLVESYAAGLPVIASRIGALAELVSDGKTGLLFDPGSAADLAQKLAWANANPDAMRTMGEEARRTYERLYSPDRNYAQLAAIYEEAIAAGGSKAHRAHA